MTDLKLVFLILLSAFSLQHVQAAVSISDKMLCLYKTGRVENCKEIIIENDDITHFISQWVSFSKFSIY